MISTTTNGFVLWWYTPTLPGSIAAVAIFALLTFTHFFYRFSRGAKFVNCLLIGECR
jgi:hypothetical protein